MFDLTYNHFYSTKDRKNLVFFTTPVQTSLSRLRGKALYNVLRFPSQNNYFITLTVDEDHYEKFFADPTESASNKFRKFQTFTRNTFMRKNHDFQYIWRIERGAKNTQRLHIHELVQSDAGLENLTQFYVRNWAYAQWECLDIEKSFKKLGGFSSWASLYAAKYSGKSIKYFDEDGFETVSESPVKTRNETKCRLWSTSRGFQCMPSMFYMKWEPEAKYWSFCVKDNYRSFQNQQLLEIAQDPVTGNWYENFAPYRRINIKSFKNCESEYDFCKRYDARVKSDHLYNRIELEELDKDTLREQLCNTMAFFSYDKPAPKVSQF